MKKIQLLSTVLAAVSVLVLLPAGNSIQAKAAAKNYAVKYCTDEWRYMEGSTFDDDKASREVYYLQQDIKDGDSVAVYNTDSGASDLNLGTARLDTLTVCNTALSIIYTGGVTNCQILENSTCSVNGNVDNAYVYDVAYVTFTGNVTELNVITEATDEIKSNIGCKGTVGHLNAHSKDNARTFYNFYNFAKDSFVMESGCILTDESKYSKTASAVSTPAPTAAPAATASPASGTTSNAASSSEYDDVPKTSDNSLVLWMLGVAAVFAAGSFGFRKAAK